MPDLHIWIQGDEMWACFEYDHGPFCRVDGISVKPEHLRAILDATGADVFTAHYDDTDEFDERAHGNAPRDYLSMPAQPKGEHRQPATKTWLVVRPGAAAKEGTDGA